MLVCHEKNEKKLYTDNLTQTGCCESDIQCTFQILEASPPCSSNINIRWSPNVKFIIKNEHFRHIKTLIVDNMPNQLYNVKDVHTMLYVA